MDARRLLSARNRKLTPSEKKIKGACARAQKQKLAWLWIDSVCLNKKDPVELNEGINSMYHWYKAAFVCYGYLDDVTLPAQNTGQAGLERLTTEIRPEHLNPEWFGRG